MIGQSPWLKVLTAMPKMLKHFPEEALTPEVVRVAVCLDGMNLEHVPERLKSKEVCQLAVKDNPRALKFVPDDWYEDMPLPKTGGVSTWEYFSKL